MKKLLILIGALLAINFATAQVKNSYELKSMPVLDMSGNMYTVVKYYDHIPTSKDSADFKIQSEIEIGKMIKEVEQKEKSKPKNDKVNRPTQGSRKRSN